MNIYYTYTLIYISNSLIIPTVSNYLIYLLANYSLVGIKSLLLLVGRSNKKLFLFIFILVLVIFDDILSYIEIYK